MDPKNIGHDCRCEVCGETMQTENAIVITAAFLAEGILETNCRDYDHYVSLPDVVSYQGVRYGKTGWSSDRHYACYKRGAMIADKVR